MVMDKFESQFDDLDLQTGYIESAIGHTTATTTPQDQVDLLIQTVADEAGLEVQHGLGAVTAPTSNLATPNLVKDSPTGVAANEEQEDALAQRLRALRPAAS